MGTAPPVDLRKPVRARDIEAVSRTFEAAGAVHVTGALPIDVLADVRSASERVFHEWDQLAADGLLPESLATPHLRRYIPLADLLLDHSPVDALLHPTFLQLARSYLDKEPELAPNSHVRSILLDRLDTHLPFHQDQTILKRALLNVWIPLDACGVGAPGLELVMESWRELLSPSPLEQPRFAVDHARLDEASVLDAFAAEAFWRPRFAPGDAMLFSGSTIHRTYVNAAMGADRMSIEIRLQ
jgi:phytanoyl-CoA dioxygenase PhyH